MSLSFLVELCLIKLANKYTSVMYYMTSAALALSILLPK